MDKKWTNEQTELHQFRKEPSYDSDLRVKFEFDFTKPFFRVQKWKCWRTDKRTNEEMELHQFRKEPSYDSDLSPCQAWIHLDKVFSR